MTHNFETFPEHISADNIRQIQCPPDRSLYKIRERITKSLNLVMTPGDQSRSIVLNNISLNYTQLTQLNNELEEIGFKVFYSYNINPKDCDGDIPEWSFEDFNSMSDKIMPYSMRISWNSVDPDGITYG